MAVGRLQSLLERQMFDCEEGMAIAMSAARGRARLFTPALCLLPSCYSAYAHAMRASNARRVMSNVAPRGVASTSWRCLPCRYGS